MALDVNGITVAVIGAGRSGKAAARLLRDRGATVLVSEQNPLTPTLQQELAALGVDSEFGGNSERVLE
ncbi:MAG TPA: UDP-N-acetylmuramoyl-L-alanine--D-glutamate ligase, partial [Candidatus Edwardsbacteria bacterium]|nr:UDP-N-acetylmuramoyl-L-alanine--D-glutamate ligase [Candidatus Edwardsbacteria bacterium]